MVKRVQFGVKAFENYASDTAFLIQRGLEHAGFPCYGKGFPGDRDCTNMRVVCEREDPDLVFCEEWNTWNPDMPQPPSKDVGFVGYDWLGEQESIFRVTKHADPWGHPEKHAEWQQRFNPDVVVVRYEIDRCLKIAPYLDCHKLVRIHHSVTREYCPEVTAEGRDRVCLLSGSAGSRAYPLRHRIWREVQELPRWDDVFTIRPHHRWSRTGGSAVPAYMRELARHRVMFVGTSQWHVSFKKHYEGTAAGCIVVTNLPTSDVVPVVEENLVRVPDDIVAEDLAVLCRGLAREWDEEKQRDLAMRVVDRYDYREEAWRLFDDVITRGMVAGKEWACGQ